MKYCEKCGAKLEDDVIYCPECGAKSRVKEKVGSTLVMEGEEFARNSYVPHKKQKTQWKFLLWIGIPMLFLLVFSFYPPLSAFVQSFFDVKRVSGIPTTVFVGFGNYISIFNDTMFWICLKNVVIFTVVGIICGNLNTIILAELLYNLKSKKTSAFFRVLFIIPILIPSVVTLLLWKDVIFSADPDRGLINQLMLALNLPTQEWYLEQNLSWPAKIAIIFTNFPWVAGTSFLIYLAGLQNISKSVMEACQLDKCGTFKRVFKVDLPLISSQLKYFLIMGVIGGFQNFDLQLIIIQKEYAPSDVLGLYLYNHAFAIGTAETYNRFGFASAVGMIILVITLTLTILNNTLNSEKSQAKQAKKAEKKTAELIAKMQASAALAETNAVAKEGGK